MIYRHTSSKGIIRKVMRDLKPNDDNWVDDAIEWIGEALEHIGSAAQLVTKKTVLHIKDNKALLPSDLYYINQVAVNNLVKPSIAAELETLTTKVNELKSVVSLSVSVKLAEQINEPDKVFSDGKVCELGVNVIDGGLFFATLTTILPLPMF